MESTPMLAAVITMAALFPGVTTTGAVKVPFVLNMGSTISLLQENSVTSPSVSIYMIDLFIVFYIF
jgi:hypothetical protein